MTGVPTGSRALAGAPPEAPSRSTAPLAAAVRRLFGPPPGAGVPGTPGSGLPRCGVEVEFIPVDRATGRPAVPGATDDGPGTAALLRSHGCARGWREVATPAGVPAWDLPDGGRVSFEPGGQIELSTRPETSLATLDGVLHRVLEPLGEHLDAAGIDLLARGLDAGTPLEDARMVLAGPRYPRQQAHYDRRGPEGRTMMLQTAGIHVNLDPGAVPLEAWAAANRIVPHLIALFANAPERFGHPSDHRSHRAALWRRLDPTRNRAFGSDDAPWEPYLDFALDADAFLLGAAEEPALPFRAWWAREATPADFAAHLTTLFPEVRPRGYLEIRSPDALPLRWCIVPAAVCTAVLHDDAARREVLAGFSDPSEERLERAGRLGLGDAALAEECRRLRGWVLAALERPGVGGAGADRATVRARTEAFFAAFLDQGRDPGQAPRSRLQD